MIKNDLGLHSALCDTNRLRFINSHDESKCSECTNGSGGRSWKLVGKMKEVVISKSTAVKDKVSELVTQAAPSQTAGGEVKHVLSSDRYGKRYRNEPSVFSIDDDSSDESAGTLFNKTSKREEVRCFLLVIISAIRDSGRIAFRAGENSPSCLFKNEVAFDLLELRSHC
ncbi:unnamed protein product [Cylicostephanus goldi]|uniref:Uncharacterized protein n=1 Tax=Cylicostephanus goldi TaxID=71465 RepID=A0A3P6TGU1_CYLGO|nr:unnamed protein product [Cylicostephanus goldi]